MESPIIQQINLFEKAPSSPSYFKPEDKEFCAQSPEKMRSLSTESFNEESHHTDREENKKSRTYSESVCVSPDIMEGLFQDSCHQYQDLDKMEHDEESIMKRALKMSEEKSQPVIFEDVMSEEEPQYESNEVVYYSDNYPPVDQSYRNYIDASVIFEGEIESQKVNENVSPPTMAEKSKSIRKNAPKKQKESQNTTQNRSAKQSETKNLIKNLVSGCKVPMAMAIGQLIISKVCPKGNDIQQLTNFINLVVKNVGGSFDSMRRFVEKDLTMAKLDGIADENDKKAFQAFADNGTLELFAEATLKFIKIYLKRIAVQTAWRSRVKVVNREIVAIVQGTLRGIASPENWKSNALLMTRR